MDITQSDRDKLRTAQQRLNHHNVVGNITEHKSQNPKKYKQLSGPRRQPVINIDEMPTVHYMSKYLNNVDSNQRGNSLYPIEEDLELGLPINPSEVDANSWLNMNQVEFDKLEWMSSKAEKAYQDRLRSTTQFDKYGRAIPTNSQNAQSQDPVEGHDIESLINLLDSTYPPQVTYALCTISRIAYLTTLGYYDGAFDENIHDILIKNFLLRVRHHIDSSHESVCQSALKCLRSILCNTRLDEVFLDRVHPLISDHPDSNLWLQTSDMDHSEFTIEMKDHECVTVDTIKALMERTDIIKKFYYLLNNKKGDGNLTYYDCILDILIRMARHSPKICGHLNRQDLLTVIIDLCLPVAISTENKDIESIAVKALKLIRIIAQGLKKLICDCSRGDKNSIECKIPESIVGRIEAYFFIDCYNLPADQPDNLFKLHLESLRLIKTLSNTAKFHNHMVDLIAMGQEKLLVTLKSLAALKAAKQTGSAISFDWQYAAHLIDLIGFSVENDRYQSTEAFKTRVWYNYVRPILLQWITDLVRQKIIPHLDVSITIATAVNHYKNRTDEKGKKDLLEAMIKSNVDEAKDGQNPKQINLFKLLARSAAEKSQLPEFLSKSGILRDPKGLPSFGSLNYNTSTEHKYSINPVFEDESPLILLNMFINNLKAAKSGTMETLSAYVDNIDLIRYIRCVTNYHKEGLEYEKLVHRSIMAQFEVQTISRSILLLGQYYLNYNEDECSDLTRNFIDIKEPKEFKEKRIECYSNLIYYAITAIGLLNTDSPLATDLTDQLFNNVLFNCKLHTRVAVESFEKEPNLASRKYDQRNLAQGGHFDKSLTDELLHVLAPLYLSSRQVNRFWMFQPLIDYYMSEIRQDEVIKKKKSENLWFQRSTNWRTVTCELSTWGDDAAIISFILSFNLSMIYCSPAYEHLIVQPDIEDYICIVGSLFLDDDLFLDESVSKSIAMNLRAMLTGTEKTGKFDSPFKDATKIIRPLKLPVGDFFDKIVNQFESVSYGDIAFSNFLLLFITPRSDKIFRRKLFQEKGETCVQLLRIGSTSVWLPREIFFNEKESDPEIKALIHGSRYITRGSFLDEYKRFHCSS